MLTAQMPIKPYRLSFLLDENYIVFSFTGTCYHYTKVWQNKPYPKQAPSEFVEARVWWPVTKLINMKHTF